MSTNALLAVASILIGLLLLFWGGSALRAVIAVWGALAGFWIGAGIIASAQNEPLLSSAAGWVTAVLVGLVLGLLAWFFYVLAVLLALGSFGFALGASVATALNASDGWAVTAGIATAILAVVIGVALNVPEALLIVLSVLLGASLVLNGIGWFTGDAAVLPVEDATRLPLPDSPIWVWAVYGTLIVVGLVAQLRPGRAAGPTKRHWQPA